MPTRPKTMSDCMFNIYTTSEIDNALVVTGVPFPKGVYKKGNGIELLCNNSLLPVWWEERAHWSDESVKWIMLHTRVAKGVNRISVRVLSEDKATCFDFPILSNNRLDLGGVTVNIHGMYWTFETPEGAWYLKNDETITNLANPNDNCSYEVSLLENSPISPLVRINYAGNRDGFITEQLLRVDPQSKRLIWTRRMTWNHQGKYYLDSAEILLKTNSKNTGSGSLLVTQPGSFIHNQNEESGYVEGRLDLTDHSLYIDKSWQRYPFGLKWNNDQVSLALYPTQARKLGVSGGTSFRHTIHLSCGKDAELVAGHTVQVVIEPEYICRTKALGLVHPAKEKPDFPGYEKAFKATLESGRLVKLSSSIEECGAEAKLDDEQNQDKDYFGLQHYGDWPMPWGTYVCSNRRIYADNEYDPAFAYYQGYAMYGQWKYLDIARHSAIHMTDVDTVSTTGDLRFHGYGENAEDHEHARTNGGNFGHYWTDGYWMLYFFEGDIWAKEAALKLTSKILGDFDSRGEHFMRSIWSKGERVLGWPMIAAMGTYDANRDKSIMETLEKIVDYIFKFTSDPNREIENEAGTEEDPIVWWRTAMQDGCKPFMIGVIMEGLERYHRETGDDRASSSIVSLAGYLITVMWDTHKAAFTYEMNAFNRNHRDIIQQNLIPLFVRGLAYAYEITGNKIFMEVSEKAFHACLWTLYDDKNGGKSIGSMGRTLGAYVTMAQEWIKNDHIKYVESLSKSNGAELIWQGGIKPLVDSGKLIICKGNPLFKDNALVSKGDSYIASRLEQPAYTDSGRIQFKVRFEKESTTWLNQRSYIHLCDDIHTRSCISIITFYNEIHVRVYDQNINLIEVVEGYISDHDPNGKPVKNMNNPVWNEDEWHTVLVKWEAPGEIILTLDGIEVDRRLLDRYIGGHFTRLDVGHKPGNWRINGDIELVDIILA